MVTIGGVLGGVVLTSGLARHDAYGAQPVTGAVVGMLAAVVYAAFILVYRDANRTPGRDRVRCSTRRSAWSPARWRPRCSIRTSRSRRGWRASAAGWSLLAIGSQVIGWLLIGTALPKLPVVETSVLLLGQPVFTVIWGVLLFDERLSALQWTGSAIVLAGVAALSLQRQHDRKKPQRRASRVA